MSSTSGRSWYRCRSGYSASKRTSCRWWVNRSAGQIYFILPSNRFLCVIVKSKEGIAVWDTTTLVPSPDARRFTMQRGGQFRDAIHFPEDAASRPGHYFAHVGVCDVDDYDITAEFDVR